MTTDKNTAPELLPCPFCGGEASIQSWGQYVSCEKCDASLGIFAFQHDANGDFDGVGVAAMAWNTRSDLSPSDQPTQSDQAKEIERLREALTPSGATKAAYIGEFAFPVDRLDENGNEYSEMIGVPWTTIKEIMAAIAARAALEERG